MGTRSLTFVHETYKNANTGRRRTDTIINMYRQMDGYPSGHGSELADFLKDIKLVNGLSSDDNVKVANGAGCLAAQLVAHFKEGPGSIYLYPTTSTDCCQAYEYHITADFDSHELSVACVGLDGPLFKGSVAEFAAWVDSAQD